jgi:hypothetical protein
MWRLIFPFVLSYEWNKIEWMNLASVCKLFQHELLYCIPRRPIRLDQIQDLPRCYAPIVTDLLVHQRFPLSFLNLFTRLKKLTLHNMSDKVDSLPECLPFVEECTLFFYNSSLPNLCQWTSLKKLRLLFRSGDFYPFDASKLPPTLEKVHQSADPCQDVSFSQAWQLLSDWGQHVSKVTINEVNFIHFDVGECNVKLVSIKNSVQWRSFAKYKHFFNTNIDILPWLVQHHSGELKRLDLCNIPLNNVDLQLLATMPCLKYLRLYDAGLTSLVYLPFFDSLEELDLERNPIDKYGLEQGIHVLNKMKKSIRFLMLTHCPCMNDAKVLQWYTNYNENCARIALSF